jgi:hypothetical protein
MGTPAAVLTVSEAEAQTPGTERRQERKQNTDYRSNNLMLAVGRLQPSETLEYETPAERFNACVASTG